MLAPDRRRLLLEHLRRHGSVRVEQLASHLGVSPATVRRDLALLEDEGRLLRAHGGAFVTPTGATSPVATDTTADHRSAVKERIGRQAATYVDDGMTIMILSGSTTGAMLSHIQDRAITVVTNGLGVGAQLAAHPSVRLVMLGGLLDREQMTLLGPMSEQNMADLHVDVMFAGAYGVDPEIGVTGAKLNQAGYHHSMLHHTDSLVVLADGEKFGRRGPTVLAGVDQVDRFVTDAAAAPAVVDALRSRGCDVVVC